MPGENLGKTKTKTPKVEVPAPINQIVLTPEQLKDIVQGAIEGALKNQPQVTQEVKRDVKAEVQTTLTQAVNARIIAGNRFSAALANPKGPRVTITIDEIYKEYLGSAVTATVNGNTIKVPVDGKPHKVHPAHYAAIKERLHYVSTQRARNARSDNQFGDAIGDFGQVSR